MSIQIRQKGDEWGTVLYKEAWKAGTVDEYNDIVKALYGAKIPFNTSFGEHQDVSYTVVSINDEKWFDKAEDAKALFDHLFELKVKHGQLRQVMEDQYCQEEPED